MEAGLPEPAQVQPARRRHALRMGMGAVRRLADQAPGQLPRSLEQADREPDPGGQSDLRPELVLRQRPGDPEAARQRGPAHPGGLRHLYFQDPSTCVEDAMREYLTELVV